MRVELIGLDMADVLLALYNNAKFAGKKYESQPISKVIARMSRPGNPDMAVKLIAEAIETNNLQFDYIDLGSGKRPIKVDLSGYDFDPSSYDDMHGYNGYAAAIIQKLRSEYGNQLKIDEHFDATAGSSFRSKL